MIASNQGDQRQVETSHDYYARQHTTQFHLPECRVRLEETQETRPIRSKRLLLSALYTKSGQSRKVLACDANRRARLVCTSVQLLLHHALRHHQAHLSWEAPAPHAESESGFSAHLLTVSVAARVSCGVATGVSCWVADGEARASCEAVSASGAGVSS
jgi:hypothetical protein